MLPAQREHLRAVLARRHVPFGAVSPPVPLRAPPAGPLDLPFGGAWHATPAGPVYAVERRCPAGGPAQGDVLAAALHASPESLALLAGPGAPASLAGAAFLDIETTSLSGGAGTYAFLAGLGLFDDGRFVVRQLFAPTPDHEPAMLTALAAQVKPLRAIVTFNGKAFDLPILEGRFILHRIRSDLGGKPHLDLLHPARRLYRSQVPSCRLADLEAHLLGVTREDDVPSQQIPARYFLYLRTGLAGPLRPVLRHNAQDVLSLALLAGRLARLTAEGARAGGAELLALARLLEARGRPEEAVRTYRRAVDALGEGPIASEAAGHLAIVLKRLGRREEAAALWRALVSDGRNLHLDPWVELAKHLEHHARDLPAALEAVDGALTLVRGRYAGLAPAWARSRLAELEHRRRRIERALRRAELLAGR